MSIEDQWDDKALAVEASNQAPALQERLQTALDSGELIARYFFYAHLPEKLQLVSMRYAVLAATTFEEIPRSAERTVALRKLLESKDAAVRAALP
jgi:hypothetical protein